MSAGAIGFIGGLMGGYINEKRARGRDDRAERTLGIHESVEGRKAFWDQKQRDWREYMESRPSPDGKSQWDQFWEDSIFGKQPGSQEALPNSPVTPRDPTLDMPQGTMEQQGPEGEAAAPGGGMGSGAPGDPVVGSNNSGGGAAIGAAAPSGAIPVAAPMMASNVATPAFNKIGRGAAEGGPIEVYSGGAMGGQYKLWEDPQAQPTGALTDTPQMSPVGTEGLLPDLERQAQEQKMLARQQQFSEGMEAAQGWADQQPGSQPIRRNPSQMRLRGAGPVQGAIDVRRSDPAMIQPQMQQWGRAAEGGPIEVMPRFAEGGMAEVPQPGAIAAEGMGEIAPAAPQQSPAAPQRQPSKYRDRLNAWQRQAENHAMMAGGLETLAKFRETENATSRRAIMGYGLDAIRSLDEGNVGDAMRSGNSALESTPFDTGMKFEASEGKLYMVGRDGKKGEPLTANHLRAFVEDNMKTPETYLEWKKQYEVERSAQKGESQRDTQLGIADRGVAVQEGYLGIAENKAPADLSKVGAEIYALITNADANAARANAADDTPGLTPALIRNINNDIPTLIQNAKIDPGTEWWGQMTQNPGLAGVLQSSAIDMAKMNLLGQGNYADAIGLSAYAFAPAAGIQVPEADQLGGIGIEGEGNEARPYAQWNGKKMFIPPSIYSALLLQYQDLTGEEPAAAPEQTAPPVIDPTANPVQ